MRKSGHRQTAAAAMIAAAIALGFASAAAAEDGGVSPPRGDQGDKPGGDGKNGSGSGTAGGASLRRLRTTPGKAFFDARRRARFDFELHGKKRRKLTVSVIRAANAAPVKSWRLGAVKPGEEPTVRWAGWTESGALARQGTYQFVVSGANGSVADTSRAEGDGTVRFLAHKFPVRGEHSYGDGLGAGRRHQGFDIPAACGTPLVAARGGRVQWRKFQRDGAGHYVVIDGRRTGLDYVYMHLSGRPLLARGERVRTGELIGYVGSSGHSTGCHLHFEVWSAPGWGAGGDFLDAEAMARNWDRWS